MPPFIANEVEPVHGEVELEATKEEVHLLRLPLIDLRFAR